MNQTSLKDIKPPLSFQANYTLLIIIVALIIVAVLVYIVMRILKKRAASGGSKRLPPAKKPHEIAYEALYDLRTRNLPEAGRVKEYYFELSKIVRTYIENRFSLKAPEMTTEEFLYSLKDSTILTGTQKNIIKEFLNQCDLVKFAKYGPNTEEIETSFNIAKRLVDETKLENEQKVVVE